MIERLAMIPNFLFHLLGLVLCMSTLSLIGLVWVPVAWVLTGDAIKGLDWLFNWLNYHGKNLT